MSQSDNPAQPSAPVADPDDPEFRRQLLAQARLGDPMAKATLFDLYVVIISTSID